MLQEREWGMPGCVCVLGGVEVPFAVLNTRGGFPERRTCGAGEEAGSETVWRKGIRAEDGAGTRAQRQEASAARVQRRPERGGGAGRQGHSGSTVEHQSRRLLQESRREDGSSAPVGAWRPWEGVMSLVRGPRCPALPHRRAS